MLKQGENYLITTSNWFYGIDGQLYRAAWGKITILPTIDELGFRVNGHYANWLIQIGEGETPLVITGCQVMYFQRSEERPAWDHVPLLPGEVESSKLYVPDELKSNKNWELQFPSGIKKTVRLNTISLGNIVLSNELSNVLDSQRDLDIQLQERGFTGLDDPQQSYCVVAVDMSEPIASGTRERKDITGPLSIAFAWDKYRDIKATTGSNYSYIDVKKFPYVYRPRKKKEEQK